MKIRVGIVGASADGSWGSRAHLPALRSLSGFEVAGVATTRPETARRAAEALAIPRAFESSAQLAEDPDIDVVAVCVRVPFHAEIIEAAIAAGKHVYCEWPLTVTTVEAQSALDAAERMGVNTAVGLQGRADPAVRMAKHLIDEGAIGAVHAVALNFSSAWPVTVPSQHVLMQDARSGLSQLELSGGHCLDALCYMLGEFKELSATLATHVPQARVFDTGEVVPRTSADQMVVQGTLVTGVTLSAHIMGAPGAGTGTRIEIQGTDGSLLLSSASRNVVPSAGLSLSRFVKGKTEPVVIAPECIAAPGGPGGDAANVANMYALFGAAIAEDKPFQHGFRAAVTRHRMLDAIRQSATDGARIIL